MKTNTNSNKPAYPYCASHTDESPEVIIPFAQGLTKREMFAMAAMQGILSNPSHNNLDLMGVNTVGPFGFIAANFAAKEAVSYADELLKQLDTNP